MENFSITYRNIAQIVMETFNFCYVHDEVDCENAVKVEGIDGDVYFDKNLLEEKRGIVIACISLLPQEFFSGYGWTFANLGLTRENYKEWTNELCVKEMLMLLAMGLGLMKYSFPRKDWNDLYEKLPYVKVYL